MIFAKCACVLLLLFQAPGSGPARAAGPFSPDSEYLRDRAALDELQRDAFKYIWEGGDPDSGMAYEATFDWEVRPVAVGGTGFGIAAIVAATDREWVTREQAVSRLMKIALFLRDKTPRANWHGGFPHWLVGSTGKAWRFSDRDDGVDIVETSMLMQGLLIARAYFNGPGVEEKLRSVITELWEGVDWNWFTNGEENGLYWHWDPEHGFYYGLKILGYNECLITYVLALSSPTHPISRKAYDYWTSGADYQPRGVYGYRLEATQPGGGPLFMSHYSFVGLDPRRLADAFVKRGYFVRNVIQTLSNRAYCLQDAPPENKYAENFWGLTASQIKGGYNANSPTADTGTVAPTAALSSMPYAPHYSLQVLQNLRGQLRKKAWGKYGPFDAISLRDDWVSDLHLAIDQLPIVSMVENYRTGLLWRLLMSDADVRAGLDKAGLAAPEFEEGFPEVVVTLGKNNGSYVPVAYDIRRHPDTGLFSIPYWCDKEGKVSFRMADADGKEVFTQDATAVEGSNTLSFPQFMHPDGEVITLTMKTDRGEYVLPVRLF